MREPSNVGDFMKKQSSLCPATMKHIISSGTTIRQLTVWQMGELLSRKGSIDRMEIALFTNLSLNWWRWKPPFRPLNAQFHGKQSHCPHSFFPPFSPALPYPSFLTLFSPLTPLLLGSLGPPFFPFPPSSSPSFFKPYPSRSSSAATSFAVLSPLWPRPTPSAPAAAWSLHWQPPLSSPLVLKAHPFGDLINSTSHAPVFISDFDMASMGCLMPCHYSSLLGPSPLDALSFLLHVISGIGEGHFHGIPW